MHSKLVIVVMVHFMLVCAPLNRQAATLERDQDTVMQCSLNLKLSQDCLNHQDTSRLNDNRQALLRHQGSIRSMPSQIDLLQELFPPSDMSYESKQITEEIKKLHGTSFNSKEQETGLLEELLVSTSIPRRCPFGL
jgi:hypothetical protein